MITSEAKLRASKKYDEKVEKIMFRVPKGERDKIKSFAEQKGSSLSSFCREAVNKAMADTKNG